MHHFLLTLYFDIGMTQICATCQSEQAYIIYYESTAGHAKHTRLCQACAANYGFSALEKPEISRVKALDVVISSEHLASARIQDLKLRQARAITAEEYEEAARLRDLISMETILAPLR